MLHLCVVDSVSSRSSLSLSLSLSHFSFPLLMHYLCSVRGTVLHYFVPFDANIKAHKWIAWCIAISGGLHGMRAACWLCACLHYWMHS